MRCNYFFHINTMEIIYPLRPLLYVKEQTKIPFGCIAATVFIPLVLWVGESCALILVGSTEYGQILMHLVLVSG